MAATTSGRRPSEKLGTASTMASDFMGGRLACWGRSDAASDSERQPKGGLLRLILAAMVSCPHDDTKRTAPSRSSIDHQPAEIEMHQYHQLASVDALVWDSFVAAHPQAHVLQLSGWGALKARFGWQAETVALASPGSTDLAAGALLLFQRRFGLTLGYVPRGPLCNWQDAAQARALLDALVDRCRRRGAAVLKLGAGTGRYGAEPRAAAWLGAATQPPGDPAAQHDFGGPARQRRRPAGTHEEQVAL